VHDLVRLELLLISSLLVGATPRLQVAVATRTSVAPRIDGDLSDAVWAQAVPLTDFTQQLPDEGQPPTQPTEVRILYDDKAIYFSFRCFDSNPKTVVANLTRRDRDSFSDNVWLDIDTYGDHQSAYHFELSAAGVQRDGIRTGDIPELGAIDFEWDAVWLSATQRNADGWTAEIAIPLTELRYRAFETVIWRMEIRRFIALRSEMDQWIFIRRTQFSEMLKYGPLVGLSQLPAYHALQLKPFLLERTTRRWSPRELKMRRGLDTRLSAGLDLRYEISSNLTLDATFLPDFGQVEADEVKLNLTTFELRYPEKRPFFLEGINLYTMYNMYGTPQENQQPFYSRRIGAAPPSPFVPSGGTLVEAPRSSQILGAAKLTGRVGRKLSVAFLDAVTATETATITRPDAEAATMGGSDLRPTSERVGPLTNFFVGRLYANLVGNLTGGLMLTSVLRRDPKGSLGLDGLCPNGKAPSTDGRCTHDANTATLDTSFKSADGTWLAHGAVTGTLITGGPARTFRDGTTIGSGNPGVGWLVQAAKAGGHLVGRLVYEAMSPRFDLNDAGFVVTQNSHRLLGIIGWREFDRGPTRKIYQGLNLSGRNSWDGVRIARLIELENQIDWKNVWATSLKLDYFPTIFDNRETGDGARTQKAHQFGLIATLTTDRTRPFYVDFSATILNTWSGYSLSTSTTAASRPLGHFELSLTPMLDRVTGDPRFVNKPKPNDDGSQRYLYGLQNAWVPGLTLRTIFTFTPTMTLQTYTQLFFASVRYGQIFETNKIGFKPHIYLSDLSPSVVDPMQFETRDAVLNINVVFRWEYLPGSVLYLVYTRSQAGGLAPLQVDSDGQKIRPPLLDFGALGRGPIEDVFLVKASYYFAR
jgi:hypothetical protein